MKLSKGFTGRWGCLLGAAALAGCTVQAGLAPEPPPPDVKGQVTLRWTIAGSDSPLQCSYYGVENLSLTLYDQSGASLLDVDAPCQSFRVTVELYPGLYHADATLVDRNHKPRSLTLPINDIRITTGTDLSIDTDFPARSML